MLHCSLCNQLFQLPAEWRCYFKCIIQITDMLKLNLIELGQVIAKAENCCRMHFESSTSNNGQTYVRSHAW